MTNSLLLLLLLLLPASGASHMQAA